MLPSECGSVLDRPFRLIAFDWDGTAVHDRREEAVTLGRILRELAARDVLIFVITGTHFGNLDRPWLRSLPPCARRRLTLATNRGSEVWGFDEQGNAALLWRRVATPEEDRSLTEAADLLAAELEARGGVGSLVQGDRVGRQLEGGAQAGVPEALEAVSGPDFFPKGPPPEESGASDPDSRRPAAGRQAGEAITAFRLPDQEGRGRKESMGALPAVRGSGLLRRKRADLCLEGYDACLEAILERVARLGDVADARVTLLQDCAELCQVAADFLLRRSPRGKRVERLCAAVCAEGAEACGGADGGPPVRRCAHILGLIARTLGAEAPPTRRGARGSSQPRRETPAR
jgi:hypothetical protein